jgi:hypothetical protein
MTSQTQMITQTTRIIEMKKKKQKGIERESIVRNIIMQVTLIVSEIISNV